MSRTTGSTARRRSAGCARCAPGRDGLSRGSMPAASPISLLRRLTINPPITCFRHSAADARDPLVALRPVAPACRCDSGCAGDPGAAARRARLSRPVRPRRKRRPQPRRARRRRRRPGGGGAAQRAGDGGVLSRRRRGRLLRPAQPRLSRKRVRPLPRRFAAEGADRRGRRRHPARAVAAARGIPVVELIAEPGRPAGTFLLDAPGASPAFAGPGDAALVLHTSGTTSRPKMVPLSGANLCASAANIAAALALGTSDLCLNVMPLFHIHGLVGAVLSSLSAGGGIFCPPGFIAAEFFGWLAAFRPSWYTAVPTIHRDVIARGAQLSAPPEHALRFIRSCSAPMPPTLIADVEGFFGVPVVEAYGMTEASHQIACNPLPPGRRKPGSVGLPAGTQVAVRGDDGRLLPPGETGEIVVQGPGLTAGYADNPEANAAAFADGWFRTGDQGYRDADGYIFLTGRSKEMINRGGAKIAPREIDDVLSRHPSVAEAIAFAMPDARLGEEVAAAVVLRPGSTADERELRAFAAQSLADFKLPRHIVFVEAIPRGPTGKPQRIGLCERLGIAAAASGKSRS